MDGMLSQDEINALLSGANLDDGADAAASTTDETLTDEQKDAIGEVSNISMGTAATTLSTLLNHYDTAGYIYDMGRTCRFL